MENNLDKFFTLLLLVPGKKNQSKQHSPLAKQNHNGKFFKISRSGVTSLSFNIHCIYQDLD